MPPNPRKPAIVFIFITLVLDVVGFGLIVPILPNLIAEFYGGDKSSSAFTYGLLVALYSGMQFLFAPLLGSLSDRFGRRPIILIALPGAGLAGAGVAQGRGRSVPLLLNLSNPIRTIRNMMIPAGISISFQIPICARR